MKTRNEQVLEVEVAALFVEGQERGDVLALEVDDLVGLGEREGLLARRRRNGPPRVVGELQGREIFFLDFLIQKWNWAGPFLSSVRLVPWGMLLAT